MASSSSSPSRAQLMLDVFLSFRGKDTRKGFTSHLYEALCKKKILTFIDDEGLIRGEEISPSLFNAIEGSRISVVIFSQEYASSRWCLEELVKILQWKNIHGQIVIPVFYHVDPSHVRNQTGDFGAAFAKLEERFKEMSEKVHTWRSALTEAANLSGFDSNVERSEAELVNKTVGDILKRLSKVTAPSDDENLFGLEARVQEIESLLNENVCILGIWGIGGIGKTTIARAVFNKISSQFEGAFFAENVREVLKKRGSKYLQQELLHAVLNDEHPNIENATTKERLGRMKILIVFDDLTSLKQIEDLIRNPKILGPKSLIIITTRDKQVLKNCDCGVDKVYKMKKLPYPESLQLFSYHAFKPKPIPKEYMELSRKVVNYAKGLPLALRVLGSSLLEKTIEIWESTINKLQNTLPLDICEVLKVSYDGLDNEEQNLFLDIACFFKFKNRGMVIKILKASGLEAECGISSLIDKSLITISLEDKITMHDLIEEMGRNIVREEKDLRKRSRLWHHRDIIDILTKNMGTEVVRGICLDISKIGDIRLNPLAFSKMHNLMFWTVNEAYGKKMYGLEHIEHDFEELRYIGWNGYKWKALPFNLNLKNLVALEMCSSELEELWLGDQNLDNLKHIDLSFSMSLLKISDLSQVPNLETLILIGCRNLREIHCSSHEEKLNELAILNLKDCRSLHSLPTSIQSKSLRIVNLSGCSSLDSPKISHNMEELCLEETAIKKLSLSKFEVSPKLIRLNLKNCSMLEGLPEGICSLTCLRYLTLSGCSNVKKIPKMPSQLEESLLDRTAIKELSSIKHLSSLVKLSLEGCSMLEGLPEGICSLTCLRYLNLSGCSNVKKIPKMPSQLERLWLDRTAIKELSSIEHLSSLVKLSLNGCLMLTNLSKSTFELQSLKDLSLSGCTNFQMLPTFSYCHVRFLLLSGTAIEEVPSSIKHMLSLEHLDLAYCLRLKNLPEDISELESLKYLNLSGCSNIELVPKLPYHLDSLWLGGTAIKELSASSIEQLSCLRRLTLEGCLRLENLPSSIEQLSSLHDLNLGGCSRLKFLPIGCKLEFLFSLDLSGCSILLGNGTTSNMYQDLKVHQFPYLPKLTYLHRLDLSDCGITELPNTLVELVYLGILRLSRNNFESLPTGMIKLIKLWRLELRYCRRLQSLPGLPPSLRELDAEGCTSLQLFSDLSILSSCRSANFIECSQLDKNKLKNTLKIVLQNIRKRAISATQIPAPWMRHRMIFPGSEILEYFEFQSNTSFIKLPSRLFTHNFVNMALCAILAPQDYDFDKKHDFEVECTLNIKGEDGCYNKTAVGSLRMWGPFHSPKYIQSDHVALGFDCDMFRYRFHGISQNSEAVINFRFTNRKGDEVDYCKVIKCGVQPFYEEGQPQSLNFIRGESSSRCELHLADEEPQPVYASSPMDDLSSLFSLLDLNGYPQDLVGSTKDAVATTKRRRAYDDRVEPSGNGCDEDKPVRRRHKKFKFF